MSVEDNVGQFVFDVNTEIINENEAFEIDGQTGILTVNDPAAFDFNVNQQLSLTVMVRDLHIDSKTDTALITVNIKQS